jgi:RNA polymerase sigma factor (TIGR02999 family)
LPTKRHGAGAKPDIGGTRDGPGSSKELFLLRRAQSRFQGNLMGQLTDLLGRMQGGDAAARDALFAAAYAELHRLAQGRLRHGGRNTLLDTTGLVHESYLRFARAGELRAEDRRAFFAYASRVMRSVVLNSVRDRIALKRGGADAQPVAANGAVASALRGDEQTVVDVHEALRDLEKADPRLAQVAEMRYFGGYSEKEIAETLEVTERTVQRDWEKARLILAAALR